jgi:hypothetical protein
MTEIDQVRHVLRERGWCQICVNGFFYNTVGNCTVAVITREKAEGWELVGVFATKDDMSLVSDPSVRPNCTVFRKPAPAFFSAENPWAEKGPSSWLHDLTIGVDEEIAEYLSNAGGHGCPGIARRFQCACGEQEVICSYDADSAKAEAECPSCQKRTLIIDVQQQERPLQVYRCECGDERVLIDLGIEYPIDASGGWNFSWITVAATCCNCGDWAILFDDETA